MIRKLCVSFSVRCTSKNDILRTQAQCPTGPARPFANAGLIWGSLFSLKSVSLILKQLCCEYDRSQAIQRYPLRRLISSKRSRLSACGHAFKPLQLRVCLLWCNQLTERVLAEAASLHMSTRDVARKHLQVKNVGSHVCVCVYLSPRQRGTQNHRPPPSAQPPNKRIHKFA